jgi:hypothetical protein
LANWISKHTLSCHDVEFGKLRISQDSSQIIYRPSFKILHCNQDFSGNSAERGLVSAFLYRIEALKGKGYMKVCPGQS